MDKFEATGKKEKNRRKLFLFYIFLRPVNKQKQKYDRTCMHVIHNAGKESCFKKIKIKEEEEEEKNRLRLSFQPSGRARQTFSIFRLTFA